MTDLFTPFITFLFGGITVALCFIFNIFKSKDGFDKVFDEEAKKVLSTLKGEEKVKKPKANRTKSDGSQKPKKAISNISQLLDRLNNSDLEPECATFLTAHLEKLTSHVSSLTEARDAANEARTTTSNRIEEHKTARVTAETKLAVMKQEISDLTKKVKEATASEKRLNDSVSSLTKQNNDLVEAAVRSKEVLAKLRSAESALTLRVRDMEYALEKANTAVENLSEDLSREVADHHTTKKELDQSKKEMQQLTEAVVSAEARAVSAVETARKEHDELLQKSEEEKSARRFEEDRFRAELVISKKLVDELSAQVEQITVVKQELSIVQSQMDVDKNTIETLRASADLKEKELQKLQSEKTEMEKQIICLEEEVAAGKDLVVVETVKDVSESADHKNTEEIAFLSAENKRLIEKNQELRDRNMKVLADFASINDQMTSLSVTLGSQESVMREETDRVKRMVVDVLSSVAPQPLDDFENDKFSSWLSSIASSAACASIGASGDSEVSSLAMENDEKTRALVETLVQLDRAEKLLKEERRSHQEEVLALKSQLCKSQLSCLSALKERVLELTAEKENIDSLHSSVSEAISSLQ